MPRFKVKLNGQYGDLSAWIVKDTRQHFTAQPFVFLSEGEAKIACDVMNALDEASNAVIIRINREVDASC